MRENAEVLLRRALEGRGNVPGKGHAKTLQSAYDLGLFYADDRPGEAEKMPLRVLRGYEKVLGKNCEWTLKPVYELEKLYAKDRPEKAKRMFQRAMQGFEEAFGKHYKWTMVTVMKMAELHFNQGKFSGEQGTIDKAEILYERALEGHEYMDGADRAQLDDLRKKMRTLGRHVSGPKDAEHANYNMTGKPNIDATQDAVPKHPAGIDLAAGSRTDTKGSTGAISNPSIASESQEETLAGNIAPDSSRLSDSATKDNVHRRLHGLGKFKAVFRRRK